MLAGMEFERNALGTALVPEIGETPMDRFVVLQPELLVKPGINVTNLHIFGEDI